MSLLNPLVMALLGGGSQGDGDGQSSGFGGLLTPPWMSYLMSKRKSQRKGATPGQRFRPMGFAAMPQSGQSPMTQTQQQPNAMTQPMYAPMYYMDQEQPQDNNQDQLLRALLRPGGMLGLMGGFR